jgi:15-cis-phytoene synthase
MDDVYAYATALVRAADRDRYIASLFAPAEQRGALNALYAFNSEVARVRDVAHASLPGEIRLQWWSDVVAGERADEAHANPVAAALLAAIERHRLPSTRLIDLIEARRFDIYDDPMASFADLETYAKNTSSVLFALAARVLSGTDAEASTEPAGVAYAIAGLLRAFPVHAARGQLYMPAELLERHQVRLHDVFAGRLSRGLEAALAELRGVARRDLAVVAERLNTLPGTAIPALLPIALVRPTLDRLERRHPFTPAEIPAWQRQWLIWRAARNPARIAG